jgi:pyruvate,water dikinase
VDSHSGWLIPLRDAAEIDESLIGGKLRHLAQLAGAGFRSAEGFCVTTAAYHDFVERNGLADAIRFELGRKPLENMRWEEMWDAALRIRSAFLHAQIPEILADEVAREIDARGVHVRWAVRSSAPGEDTAQRSFAGLHESIVDVAGASQVLDAIRLVWASLWSDAALLYRRELGLDPTRSAMAVGIQQMIDADRAGVAFARDPRDPEADRAVIEAVPGPCRDLVDGLVDPDRWLVSRSTGDIIEWRAGKRDGEPGAAPLLEAEDLEILIRALLEIEARFGWPPDVEWIDRGERLALVQARPITTLSNEAEDSRAWYLSLRPGAERLARLCDRVEGELIPRLAAEGESLAAEKLDDCDDEALAGRIEQRLALLIDWRRVYREDFIPMAHGVRQLGLYYEEVVRPSDPFEFVGLLQFEPMAASRRNQELLALAVLLREHPPLRQAVERAATLETGAEQRRARAQLAELDGGAEFAERFDQLLRGALDVSFEHTRLSERPDLLLKLVLALAARAPIVPRERGAELDRRALEKRLLEAVGPERESEARDVLRIARTSWRLRDDDNLLLGRVESQLLRAVRLGLERLHGTRRLEQMPEPSVELAPVVVDALRGTPEQQPALHATQQREQAARVERGVRPRQLVGQPAGPGAASGPARRIRGVEDLGLVRAGDVLVCDAIQPSMTHLIPVASAIVERRGGMLIHGAIIARELGIPCVNGIADAVDLIGDGEPLFVDGDLGIVTVGEPEFDLEKQRAAAASSQTSRSDTPP